MKKILTALGCILLSYSSFAQTTIWKDTVTFEPFPKDGLVHELYDSIINNTSSVVTLTWSVGSSSLQTGYTGIGICDKAYGTPFGTCYGFTDMSTHTIDIPANGRATIDIQMKAIASAADGPSYVTVNTNFGPMVFKYNSWPTAVRDFDHNNIVSIYPNPATDIANINILDKKITSINVVNVIGRRIARFSVDANKNEIIRVPLDKVADGIYLLQFADASGKVLGVRRVTKQ